VSVASAGSTIGDEGAGHVNEREMVLRNCLPASAERAEVVVPALGALDNPASRAPADAANERRFAASTNVRSYAAPSSCSLADAEVVALVQTQMARSTWATRRAQLDGVEYDADQPHVVDVGSGQSDGNRDAAAVAKDMAFGAELAAIGGIGTGEVPPFGAFTEALSREHQVQSMPRSSS
jgi:hypothetical protein